MLNFWKLNRRTSINLIQINLIVPIYISMPYHVILAKFRINIICRVIRYLRGCAAANLV